MGLFDLVSGLTKLGTSIATAPLDIISGGELEITKTVHSAVDQALGGTGGSTYVHVTTTTTTSQTDDALARAVTEKLQELNATLEKKSNASVKDRRASAEKEFLKQRKVWKHDTPGDQPVIAEHFYDTVNCLTKWTRSFVYSNFINGSLGWACAIRNPAPEDMLPPPKEELEKMGTEE